MKKYSFLYNHQLSPRHRQTPWVPTETQQCALVLHGQKNGPYGALPKLQIKEEDSATSAGELQRNTFNLHIFVMCCKISATTFTFIGVNKNFICIWGRKAPIYIMSCCQLSVLW